MTVLPHDEYLKAMQEQGTVLACSLASEASGSFRDNEKGVCHFCQRPIVYRPYNEKAILKACLYCCIELSKQEGNAPFDAEHTAISEQVKRDELGKD